MNPTMGPTMKMIPLAASTGTPREFRKTFLAGLARASTMLRDAQTAPAHFPDDGPLTHALRVVFRVLDEGRTVVRGSHAAEFAPASIEEELYGLVERFPSSRARCEISVTGRRRKLTPEVQEQISLIGREALTNALRHSGATRIEAEVEYSARRLRLIVRDNGRGLDRAAACNEQRGLLRMRQRAERIGAKLTIWSKRGAGTEVEISVPSQALTDPGA